MAKRPRTPAASSLRREPTTAYARRHRTEGGDGDDAAPAPAPPEQTAVGSGPNKAPDPGTVGAVNPDAPAPPAAAPIAPADAPTVAVAADPDIKDKDKDKGKDAVRAKDAGKDPAGPAATHADPTPSDSTPVTATPEASAPELEPPDAASASIAADPLPLMPHPTQIPPGNPDDPADAPGTVPPGDSRSLRRGGEFVLVYRVANIVVSRFGPVGKRGQFRVVEYPTTSYASNAYARECSRWVSEGFSDYRGP